MRTLDGPCEPPGTPPAQGETYQAALDPIVAALRVKPSLKSANYGRASLVLLLKRQVTVIALRFSCYPTCMRPHPAPADMLHPGPFHAQATQGHQTP